MTRVAPALLNFLVKANVLIDQTGHARLADLGLLTIVSDPRYGSSSSSHTQGDTVRWMSPECISPERFGFKNSRPTISSDCYALGMVVYETISGNIPFHKDTDLTVSKKVVKGKRPPRGAKFTTSMWEMLGWCWAPKPNDRPSIEDVLRHLEAAPNLSEPTSPRADEGTDDGDSDWDSPTSSFGGDSSHSPTFVEGSTSNLTPPEIPHLPRYMEDRRMGLPNLDTSAPYTFTSNRPLSPSASTASSSSSTMTSPFQFPFPDNPLHPSIFTTFEDDEDRWGGR